MFARFCLVSASGEFMLRNISIFTGTLNGPLVRGGGVEVLCLSIVTGLLRHGKPGKGRCGAVLGSGPGFDWPTLHHCNSTCDSYSITMIIHIYIYIHMQIYLSVNGLSVLRRYCNSVSI